MLKGSGAEKPLLLLNHIDVVAADDINWKVPPFSGEINEGFIWGRGALDMKSTAVVQLMSMLILKRLNLVPKRDIVFLAVADEELGGKYGMEYLLKNHSDILDVAAVLNEGGIGLTRGNAKVFTIESSQKARLWIKLTANGKLCHSSNQKKDDASQRLVKALNRVFDWDTPVKLTPTTKVFFKNLYSTQAFPKSFLLKNVTNGLLKPIVLRSLKKDEYFNLLIRDTISLTRLDAGCENPGIPDVACAEFDCRLLPGHDFNDFIHDLGKVINDESVIIDILPGSDKFNNIPSPVNTFLYKVIDSVVTRHLPDFIVTPVLIPGTSDSRFFRKQNIPAYGFQPFVITSEDMRAYHSVNERISVENIQLGVKMMTELIAEFTHI